MEETEGIANPTITLTGDFNFPFITDWSMAGLESFTAKVTDQEDSNQCVADKKKQAALFLKLY